MRRQCQKIPQQPPENNKLQEKLERLEEVRQSSKRISQAPKERQTVVEASISPAASRLYVDAMIQEELLCWWIGDEGHLTFGYGKWKTFSTTALRPWSCS